LRALILQDPTQRKWLETLLHPLIRKGMTRQCQQISAPYLLLAIPLLVENGWYELADHVVVVDIPVDLQKLRLLKRDDIAEEQAEQLIAAQATREQRLQRADSVINNTGDSAALRLQVEKLHEYFKKTER